MTAEEQHMTHAMYADGWTHAEIARTIGVSEATVRRTLDPARAQANRAADEARRAGRCEICGVPTSHGRTRCVDHRRQVLAAELRRAEIASRWRDGQSTAEIADAMGSTPGSIGVEICHMRKRGWDLPYRYNVAANTAGRV